jgi:hypothetical protein
MYFESWVRWIAVTELLKQFVPLSDMLSNSRVNFLHIVLSFVNFALFGGALLYNIDFSTSNQDRLSARWFRYGTLASYILQSAYIISSLLWQAYLIHKHTTFSKSKVSDYPKKKKRVFLGFSVIHISTVISFLHFVIGIIFDDEPNTNGSIFYHDCIHITVSHSMILGTMMPILFEGIVALKFEKSKSKVAVKKLEIESRLPFTDKIPPTEKMPITEKISLTERI